ncbi:MAG: hypothetical protein H0X27_12545 [Caulobacteraceae bacterium]|nr:hypothetical protein [Caulobacteraceae bacterium]
MKLSTLAVTTLAVTALVGGTAVAQATMQPIPNPGGGSSTMMHHHMHHHMRHHMKKKMRRHAAKQEMKSDTMAAPDNGAMAPAPSDTPPSK